MQTCDVAVLGAGIVGAACAYELATSGLRVTVVEPNAVVAGGTNLGYGSLAIVSDLPGQFELTRYGLQLWHKLVEWLPEDCEYGRRGTVWIATDEAEMSEVVSRREFFNRNGVEAELLDERQLAEAEPGLRLDLAGGFYVPGDGCLRADRAAELLLQVALGSGAKVLRQRAHSIEEQEVRLDDGTLLYAGNIVNAAGMDAVTLSSGLAVELSKGHVLVVETESRCTQHQISGIAAPREAATGDTIRFEARQREVAYNKASEVWLGSSYGSGTEDALRVEPRMAAALLRQSIEMMPAIAHARPLRSWAGWRVATADGLPLIGRIAGKDGIFVATGHAGYGATSALATAKLIADEILGRTSEIDPKPYLADRFEGKQRKHAE